MTTKKLLGAKPANKGKYSPYEALIKRSSKFSKNLRDGLKSNIFQLLK